LRSNVTATNFGALLSSGTISVSQTSMNGSTRERQYRRGVCEGKAAAVSIRRALRSLMPALAAANFCELFFRWFM